MKKMIAVAVFGITTAAIIPSALADTHAQAMNLVNQAEQLAKTQNSTAMYSLQPSQQISEQALSYGRTHQSNGLLGAIAPKDCIQEVQTLTTDSIMYASKAEQGTYKKVGGVNGNLVMRIMANAATVAGTMLNSFNVCSVSPVAGYDSAAVLDMGLKITDKNFS